MKTIATRTLATIPTLLGVFIVVFIIIRLIPGDPAFAMLGPDATEAELEAARASMGLDKPIPVQFFEMVTGYLVGDFGTSMTSRRPVAVEIATRLPDTALLAVSAGTLSLLIGVPIGIYAAIRRDSWVARLLQLGGTLGIATPTFWFGIVLAGIFAVGLGWFSSIGTGRSDGIGGMINALVLPSVALALPISALIMRMTRSSMLEVLGEDYVRTARAKGLHPTRIILGHALRNAAIPILTVAGISFGEMLSGALVIETVFARPGLGKLLFDAILDRNYPVVQAVCVVIALVFVAINLITDIAYKGLDPRMRRG